MDIVLYVEDDDLDRFLTGAQVNAWAHGASGRSLEFRIDPREVILEREPEKFGVDSFKVQLRNPDKE